MPKNRDDSAEIEALIAKENAQPDAAGLSQTDRILMRLVGLMENRPQSQTPQAATDNKAIETLSGALERFAEAQEEMVREQKRGTRPSNNIVPMRSSVNPRGELLSDHKDPEKRYTKPKLVCPMFLPFPAEDEMLTREEVELCNILAEMPGEYLFKKIDNSKVRIQLRVEFDINGKRPTKVTIFHDTAFNRDHFRLLPPMADWMRYVIRQADNPELRARALKVLSMEEEEELIEKGELAVSV